MDLNNAIWSENLDGVKKSIELGANINRPFWHAGGYSPLIDSIKKVRKGVYYSLNLISSSFHINRHLCSGATFIN